MPHMFGWKPDSPDQRDRLFSVAAPIMLPKSVNLTSFMPPVYDQGQLGSCTANAIGALVQYQLRVQHLPDWIPSRLFIYYQERLLEGTVRQDSGAMIRDGLKVVHRNGAPPEIDWPYVISKFTLKPPANAYVDAARTCALEYRRVARTLNAFRTALALKHPIVIGFSVYESFENIGADGIGNLPTMNETLLGGHAVLIVGYDDTTQRFLIRNSWGSAWGNKGYFTLPYGYLMDHGLASDFWTITELGKQ